ncbi:peptide deformylase [Nocardia colli]|uniref:Peptide deformylase n=1 Tax=Nocardia colli TaxID=2545717 RepID=A0A5N0EMI0_9NOCA|nr:peptide deformylase [Nocardia colli]KAA8889484.1 peptide deformylase [Nocardia colli]
MNVTDMVVELLDKYRGTIAPLTSMGDPVLRRPAEPVTGQIDTALLKELSELMLATMHATHGVGLAAPQIGIPLRIAVIGDTAEIPEDVAAARKRIPVPDYTIINPLYTAEKDSVAFYEGCLSMPGYQAVVPRPETVHAEYDDLDGVRQVERITGWPARIFQHETDHLVGTIYIDKALTRSLTSNETYLSRWAQPTPTEAAEALGFPLPQRIS